MEQGANARDDVAPLASALAEHGVDVVVYCCRGGATGQSASRAEAGYRVVHLPGAGTAGNGSDAELAAVMGDFARFLTARWTEDPPDVVGSASWIYGVAAQLAADRCGVPSVSSLPELGHVVQRRQRRRAGPPQRPRFERLIARSAAGVMVSCNEDLAELVGLGCSRRRLSLLPRPVDARHFSPEGPAVHRTDRQRIVTVTRDLLPYRGVDDAIRALSRLPGAELVVVGGPDRHSLDKDADARRLLGVARAVNVSDRVHLTGHVSRDDLPRVLRSADVFVAPSWYQPFGVALVEAMACGLPVVASAAGGMLDTVVNDVTGVLVPPRNPFKLAKSLDEVLRAGALRSGMGLAGRVRAQSRYCSDRVAAEAAEAYEVAARAKTVRGAGGSSSSTATNHVA